MREKKDPLLDCNPEEGKNELVQKQQNFIKSAYDLQVHISNRGYVLHGFKRGGSGKPENLKKRVAGDIVGWSKESRMRLRRYLMDWTAPEGWANYALTLTVPGPTLEPLKYREMWEKFNRRISKNPLMMVWRCEIQKRGALHWHCVLSLPAGISKMTIVNAWWKVVEELGEVHNYETKNGIVTFAGNRMVLFGAMDHSVDIQEEKENDSWWRYLADHTSKSKQEQIGENIGRHWGVVGRKYAKPAISEEVTRLDTGEFFKLVRFLRRMSTPRVKKDNDPFGYCLGWAPNLSKWGRSDRFGRGDAVSRLVRWLRTASSEPQSPQGSPEGVSG